MKSNDDPIPRRLERLLDAAQSACPTLPQPSPWFEQRMLQRLHAETSASFAALEGGLIFRTLCFAAVVALVSVALPLLQVKNPYRETLEIVNSAAQTSQFP